MAAFLYVSGNPNGTTQQKIMTEIHHLNCVKIVSPINANVCGHCLLLKENDKLILVDTGIGLSDTLNPIERIGQQLIDIVGYRFSEKQTAVRQIENLGLDPENVTDCIISHLDNDHIGGLADFPKATVHVGIEELDNFHSENPRYLKIPLAHNPTIKTYEKSDFTWYGFEARRINLNIETEIFLVPLFGHTLGHCGVALKINSRWLFYVADAYYMRLELNDSNHPVSELTKMRADNNDLRIATLDKIRRLVIDHQEIEVFGYHDIEEFTKAIGVPTYGA
jgi:glyoxylase-like metal-dependent hydrolase (beta-lactamase superfamily II)